MSAAVYTGSTGMPLSVLRAGRAEVIFPFAINFIVGLGARQVRSRYAAEMAGTNFDLDSDLESAGIEHLVKTRRKGK